MLRNKELSKILIKAEELALEFIKRKPSNPLSFPTEGGVYVIRHKKKGILYIGKARNLFRRVCVDHLSAETRDTMSAFRRTLHKTYKIPYGMKMRKWIQKNCRFSCLEIPNPDMRSLVESLLIVSLRSEILLNKS